MMVLIADCRSSTSGPSSRAVPYLEAGSSFRCGYTARTSFRRFAVHACLYTIEEIAFITTGNTQLRRLTCAFNRTITVKSRLIPLHLRVNPPLLAPETLLSAYHHAADPESFDLPAINRESLAAHTRTHPGIGDEPDREKIRIEKESWNKLVNWVMDERRIEKLRTVGEERGRRLLEVARTDDLPEAGEPDGIELSIDSPDDWCPNKRRVLTTIHVPATGTSGNLSSVGECPVSSLSFGGRSGSPAASIFGHGAVDLYPTPRKTAASSVAGLIRPALSTPQHPNTPRRFAEKKRNGVYTGLGEYSPKARGGTYTPPRILPSGDETAPIGRNDSPAPTLRNFDFVSPLGPVMHGKLSSGEDRRPQIVRKASLEVVKEEAGEDNADGWTLVQGRRGMRAGSLPCREKAQSMGEGNQLEGMDLET